MASASLKKIGGGVAGWLRRGRDVGVLVAIVLAFVIGYALRGGGDGVAPDAQPQQWYTCSMHPEVRMPNKDDLCPYCPMTLVPASTAGADTDTDADAELGPRQIKLSAAAQALIDVETTPVVRRLVHHQIHMVGQVEYDETRLVYITAYVGGRLDRLFVDYAGIAVRAGDHLAEIYSPKLIVAQEELIEARRAVDRLGSDATGVMAEGAGVMLDAARERLRLLGLSDAQIEAAENENVIGDHVTLHTPTGGVVIAKNARQGSYVAEGDRIYTIADLSQVWVILEAYESDLPWLRYGQTVSFRTEAFGDQTFEGTIAFIDPTLDAQRRTVRVRVNVNNEAGDLRSGMFVRGRVSAAVASAGRVIAEELAGKWISPMHPEIVRDEPGDCPVCGMALVRAEELGYATATQGGGEAPLVIPDTAVLRTGQRGVVYVKVSGEADAVFEGREVQLGPRGDGFFVVTAGLDEGDLVVTRGNFQIDSALQLQGQGQASMMNPHGGPSGAVHAHHGMPQQAGPGSPQRTTTRPSTTQPSTTQPMDHGGHDEQ